MRDFGEANLTRQREQYEKLQGEDIFGDEDCSNKNEISVTKYKENEQIGQCEVEEIVEEEEPDQPEEEAEEPTIEDAAPKEPEMPLP